MEIVWSVEARADLVSIRDFLSEHSPSAGRAVVEAIRHAANTLRNAPALGHVGENSTREWLVTRYPSYLLVYQIREEYILILRVWHQSRDR